MLGHQNGQYLLSIQVGVFRWRKTHSPGCWEDLSRKACDVDVHEGCWAKDGPRYLRSLRFPNQVLLNVGFTDEMWDICNVQIRIRTMSIYRRIDEVLRVVRNGCIDQRLSSIFLTLTISSKANIRNRHAEHSMDSTSRLSKYRHAILQVTFKQLDSIRCFEDESVGGLRLGLASQGRVGVSWEAAWRASMTAPPCLPVAPVIRKVLAFASPLRL